MKAHPERFSEKMVRSSRKIVRPHGPKQASWKARSGDSTPRYAHTAGRCLRGSIGNGQRLWRTGNSQFPVGEVLDLSADRALDLLRQAEGLGLVRVRSAGDVIEISVRQPIALALGVAQIEHV